MDSLGSAKQLTLEGRFVEAFKVLSEPPSGLERRASDVLKVEVPSESAGTANAARSQNRFSEQGI